MIVRSMMDLSDAGRCADEDHAEPTTVGTRFPGMINAVDDGALTGLQPVHAIVEGQFDASLQHDVDVDGVRVVHRVAERWRVVDDLPTNQTRGKLRLEILALPAGTRRRRG